MGTRQHEGEPMRAVMCPEGIIDQMLKRTRPCLSLPPADPPLAVVLLIILPVLAAARLGIVIV